MIQEKQSFLFVYNTLKRYKSFFCYVFIASFVIHIIALVSPLFTMTIIDRVIPNHAHQTLDILILGFGIVTIFELILSYISSYLSLYTSTKVTIELSTKIFRHIFRLPFSFFEKYPTGNILSRVGSIDALHSHLSNTPISLFLDVVFGIVFLCIILHLSPLLTAIVLLMVPLQSGINWLNTKARKPLLQNKIEKGNDNQGFIIETLSKMETMKATVSESLFVKKWMDRIININEVELKMGKIDLIFSILGDILNKGSSIFIWWYGVRLVMKGEISLGQYVAFNMFVSRVTEPLFRLGSLFKVWQNLRMSSNQIEVILKEKREDYVENEVPIFNINEVKLDSIYFSYDNKNNVIKDVNLSINKNEVIAFLGESGSGKTTISKLFQGLYFANSGSVYINGCDIKNIDIYSYRSRIGVVDQQPQFFKESIKNNLILGKNIDTNSMIKATKAAHIHERIMRLPQQYDTMIEDEQSNLSVGERQRLAIARAILKKPSLLILDEITSALDIKTEEMVISNLKEFCKECIIIIITHSYNFLEWSDRIIVLRDGSIVRRGTHEELFKKTGKSNFYKESKHLETEICTI